MVGLLQPFFSATYALTMDKHRIIKIKLLNPRVSIIQKGGKEHKLTERGSMSNIGVPSIIKGAPFSHSLIPIQMEAETPPREQATNGKIREIGIWNS